MVLEKEINKKKHEVSGYADSWKCSAKLKNKREEWLLTPKSTQRQRGGEAETQRASSFIAHSQNQLWVPGCACVIVDYMHIYRIKGNQCSTLDWKKKNECVCVGVRWVDVSESLWGLGSDGVRGRRLAVKNRRAGRVDKLEKVCISFTLWFILTLKLKDTSQVYTFLCCVFPLFLSRWGVAFVFDAESAKSLNDFLVFMIIFRS